MQTPWGPSDSKTKHATGITFYTTAGHGGFKISESRRRSMPVCLRDLVTFVGGNWYEEDCDAAIVIVAFPWLFSDEQVADAVEAVQYWRKIEVPAFYELTLDRTVTM